MSKGMIALLLLLIGGEGFRLWWFGDKRAEASARVGVVASEVLHFDPDLVANDLKSALAHHSDPQQEKNVDRLLGHDRSRCGLWQDDLSSGLRVHYTWVEYDAGNTHYLRDLFGHPPEVCVGKSGATLLAIHPDRTLVIGDRGLAVRHVEFADPISGTPFQILKFVWLPKGSPLQFDDGRSERDLRSARLNAAWHGMPRSEARMMIVVVLGVDSAEKGWQQFKRIAETALSTEPSHAGDQLADSAFAD